MHILSYDKFGLIYKWIEYFWVSFENYIFVILGQRNSTFDSLDIISPDK